MNEQPDTKRERQRETDRKTKKLVDGWVYKNNRGRQTSEPTDRWTYKKKVRDRRTNGFIDTHKQQKQREKEFVQVCD